MMKNLICIATLIFAAQAFSCEQYEAEFIGKVKNQVSIARSESITECFYEVEYSLFNASYICPLDIDVVSTNKFQDYNCSLKNGDQVSGVLVLKNNVLIVE